MADIIFKRKIYDSIKRWKEENDGKSALLVEGARRVGKSTIVEQFARNEYESYILIDFGRASSQVKSLFDDGEKGAFKNFQYLCTCDAFAHTRVTQRNVRIWQTAIS